MPRYTIRSGCSFKQPDGTTLAAGDEIELPDDVANSHADKLDLLPDEGAVQASALLADEEH